MSDQHWDPLRDRGIVVTSERMAGGGARFYPRLGVVIYDSRLTETEQRVAACHELIHVERGHEPCATDWHDGKQERGVDIEAARRLISLSAFIDALRWTNDDAELAELLNVDRDTLHVRSSTLSPAEVTRIERELWDEWRTA